MAVQSRNDVTIRRLLLSGEPKVIDNATISQSSAATAGTVTDTTTYAVADQDTLTLSVTVDGGTAQPILFDITVTTALLVAQQLNDQLIGCSSGVVTGQVVITSDTTGVGSSIVITAGTSALTWAAPVDGTGAVAILENTAMVQDPATEEWTAFTDVTATDGTEFPRGVFVGSDISAADLAAADVTGQLIMVGGPITMDEDLVVFQNSIAYDDEITNLNITVRSALISIGLNPEKTEFVSHLENL